MATLDRDWNHLTTAFILLNIVCTAIGVATIFLNLFVICTILGKPRQWNVTLTFLMNLAVADTMTGFLVIYNVIYNCVDYNVFLECAFRSGCAVGIIGSSAFIIVGLGFERYVKIVTPLRYMHVVSSTNIKGYLILVWIMASILAFSPIISWLGKTPVVTYCDFFTVLQDQYLLVASCILFTLLAFMCFMYGHILYIASKKTRSEETLVLRPRLDSANQRLAPSSKWLKPTKVVLLVVGVNFVTLLPICVYFMVVLGGHMNHLGYKETGTVVAYVAAPAYLNSLVNPIIYAFKIPYIRATFNRKFACKTQTGHRVSFNSRRSRRCSSIVTSTL